MAGKSDPYPYHRALTSCDLYIDGLTICFLYHFTDRKPEAQDRVIPQ